MTSAPEPDRQSKTRTAVFAALIGIVVTTSVVPMAWWTAKALGLL